MSKSLLEMRAAVLGLGVEERRELAAALIWSLPREDVIAIHSRLSDMMQKDIVALLPPELSIRILSMLSVDDLLRCSAVSQPWHRLATDQSLWHELCRTHQPPIIPGHTTWNDLAAHRRMMGSQAASALPARSFGDESFEYDDGIGGLSPTNTSLNGSPAPRIMAHGLRRMVWERPHGGLPTYQRMLSGSPKPPTSVMDASNSQDSPIPSHLHLPSALPTANYRHLYLVYRILSRRMTYTRPADMEAALSGRRSGWDPRVTIIKPQTSVENGGLPGHTESIYSLHLFRRHLSISCQLGSSDVDELASNLGSAFSGQHSFSDVFGTPVAASWPGLGNTSFGRGATPAAPTYMVNGRDWLLSASRDQTLRLWQIGDSEPRVVKVFAGGHTGSILCHFMVEVPIKTQVASPARTSRSPIKSGKAQATPKRTEPRTRLIAVSGGGDGRICLWDIENGDGTPERVIEAHTDSVFFVRGDDERVVSCSKDRTIRVFDIHTLEQLLVIDETVPGGHRGAINTVNLTKEFIVSASGDRSIKIWDIHTGALLASVDAHVRGISSIAFEPGHSPHSGWAPPKDMPDCTLLGTIVTGSSDQLIKTFHIVQLPAAAELDRVREMQQVSFQDMLDGDTDSLTDSRIVIRPGSEYKALCSCPMPSSRPNQTGCMRCFNRGHTDLVRSLHLLDKVTLSASYDSTIKMWDRETGRLIFDFDGCHSGRVFAITGDRTRVVSSGLDARIAIVDFSDGLDTSFV